MLCTHLDSIREITPSANGCEACLKTGDSWALLHACRQCGHIGCRDSSININRHATRPYHATGHPVVESCDPQELWGWRYIDQEMLDFSGHQTIHRHASSVAFEDRKW